MNLVVMNIGQVSYYSDLSIASMYTLSICDRLCGSVAAVP